MQRGGVMQVNERRAMLRLQENPKRILDNARKGVTEDLVELANYWPTQGPELLKLGILDVFFTHLDGSLVPIAETFSPASHTARRNSQPAFTGNPTIDRAWVSLVGLTKVGTFMMPSFLSKIDLVAVERNIIQGWEGTFKWCTFFYEVRIGPLPLSPATVAKRPPPAQKESPEIRRAAMDLLCAVLYSLTRSERARRTMARTDGCIEMATRLWILEEEGPVVQSTQDIPVGTAALDGLLTVPDYGGRLAEKSRPGESEEDKEERLENEALVRRAAIEVLLNRVVRAAGGSASSVVQLALSRVKTVVASPEISRPHTPIYLDLMGHLSRGSRHALRAGFLAEGAIAMCTKLAVKLCGILDRNLDSGSASRARIGFQGPADNMMSTNGLSAKDDNLLGGLVASLGYLANCLESTDGFSWVSSALTSGMLTAWVGAAKLMKYMDPDDSDMVISLVRDILPRYLVYRSVIINVKNAVARIRDGKTGTKKGGKGDKGKANWDIGKRRGEDDDLGMVDWSPEARKAWRTFEKLALERYMVSIHMKVIKGKAVTCDNVKCQRVDTKNNFMKCAGCYNTMYCSRECQVTAWKEGGHKLVCKLKQQELAEGKYQIVSKPDSDYFHHLSTRDARHNLSRLRQLAKVSYPDLAPTALVICIDYLNYPTKFSVHPLSEHEKHAPRIGSDASANSEARNDELINRAREHPGKYGIIQSKIANGQGTQMVLSVVPGIFWDDAGWTADDVKYRAEDDDDDAEEEAWLERLKAQKGKKEFEDGDDDYKGKDIDDVDMMMARMALNRFLKSRGEPETF